MQTRTHTQAEFSGKLAIIVGGSVCDCVLLKKWADQTGADILAADSGIHHCLSAGLEARAVIGDMDSVSANIKDSLSDKTAWIALDDQNSTDLEKLLWHMDYQLIVGFGFLDRRFDHSLAALTILARYGQSHRVILAGTDDVVYVTNKALTLRLAVDDRLSVWPLSEVSFLSSGGLEWDLAGLTMSPEGQIGTSNRVALPEVSIIPDYHSTGYFAVISDNGNVGQFIDAVASEILS